MVTKRRGEHLPDGDPDSTYVFSREEDRSKWARVSLTLDKYKPLVWLAGLLLVAAGFGFKTPSDTFGKIHGRLDTLEIKERKSEGNQFRIENKLDMLVKLRCMEMIESKRDRDMQLVGLDCVDILRAR